MGITSKDTKLHWLDYGVFVFCIGLSVGVGFYHAIRSYFLVKSGNGRITAKDEYLMGGRTMPPVPVALSLLTTFLSGILMLGVPAEMFQNGIHIWMNFVVGMISSLLTGMFFLPVFYKMKSTCLHEYFNHRYNSFLIRRLFSALFLTFTIVYMAIVIYAPAVALSSVLEINKWYLVLTFGLCTTLYTCIGGLKAVVWTDSLQAILMYAGVFAVIFKGLAHPRVGGLERVWSVARESGRFHDLQRTDWTLAQNNSLWINLFSGTITWLASFGVNQLAIQRYSSLPTLKEAQKIIYWTMLPFFFLCSIVSFVGLIALAYFYNCNPIETGEITDIDHITILFARDVLQPTPGLFGLYVSCIMSATLSTLSSGMNSMAAAIYEDFLKVYLNDKLSDRQVTKLNKGITVVCGLLSTALAFSAGDLGGILKMCISVMGAMSGPMVGIFVLAMFFPRSGYWSCLISFIVSNAAMVYIYTTSYKENPYKYLYLPTNTTVEGCGHSNFTLRPLKSYEMHYGRPDTSYIARISQYSYALVGFLIMMFVGVLISKFYPEEEKERVRHLTFAGRYEPWPAESKEELEEFIQENKTDCDKNNITRISVGSGNLNVYMNSSSKINVYMNS